MNREGRGNAEREMAKTAADQESPGGTAGTFCQPAGVLSVRRCGGNFIACLRAQQELFFKSVQH